MTQPLHGLMRKPMTPRPHSLWPILATALAIALFSLMDALMKSASLAVGAYNALLFRSLIGSVLMLPVWWLGGCRWPDRLRLRMHLLRGAVAAGMVMLFFFALVRLPIAEAIALSFIAPLFALYLAAVMLGEQIGRRAIIASVLGFAGMLVIVGGRISRKALDQEVGIGILAVLGSALLYAWSLVLQRRIAQIADPREITFAQNLIIFLILLLFAPWLALWPGWAAMGPISLSAILACGAILLLSWAYARAETQVLVPIEYTAFLWAMLFGWLFFAEQVGSATLAGAALIVAGCWIGARKRTEQTAL